MKKLRVTVDGKVFEVIVESVDEPGQAPVMQAFQQTSIAPPASSAPKAAPVAAAGPGAVTSPLAGRIVSIDCQVGQKVTSGTQLATVEAMKMNTFVYAAGEGNVATIHVSPGDAVEEGQALVTLA